MPEEKKELKLHFLNQQKWNKNWVFKLRLIESATIERLLTLSIYKNVWQKMFKWKLYFIVQTKKDFWKKGDITFSILIKLKRGKCIIKRNGKVFHFLFRNSRTEYACQPAQFAGYLWPASLSSLHLPMPSSNTTTERLWNLQN